MTKHTTITAETIDSIVDAAFQRVFAPKPQPAPNYPKIREMAANGFSRADVAEALGITIRAVDYRVAKMSDVTFIGRPAVPSEAKHHAIISMTKLGRTRPEIAAALDVTIYAVRHYQERFNVMPKDYRKIRFQKPKPKPKPVKARELTPLERMQQMARNESRAAKEYTGSRA